MRSKLHPSPNSVRSPHFWQALVPLVASVISLAALGCSSTDGDRPMANPGDFGGSAGSGGSGSGGSSGSDASGGKALYDLRCATCHGGLGEGVTAPALREWSRGRDKLVEIIDTRMPPGDPSLCTGDCAEKVADYVLTFKGPITCDSPPALPRSLRLLSRREYRNTVAELIPATVATGEPQPAESCSVTFSFNPSGQTYNSVHVAGSFNNWAGTIASGGWAMSYDNSNSQWSTEHSLSPGTYTYKFVTNESTWIADPSNPNTESDGFGGVNSVLTVTCPPTGTGVASDPTTGFPLDSRPEGFYFDTSVNARVVTSSEADAYWTAARNIADLAVADMSTIVPCDPVANADTCATSFVESFGRKAFRRPLSSTEVTRYVDLLKGRSDFKSGVHAVVRAMLTSPSFLYRTELGELQSDGNYLLTPLELASTLSYALWGTMPDDELISAAESGTLSTPEGLENQARRMLEDPKARETIATFAEQWLGTESILTVEKNAGLYPEVNTNLRAAMREETRKFVTHVVFDSTHQFQELLTADYTFANADLAAIYEIDGASASLDKVTYPSDLRAGILGHASILGTYAHSDQSSPFRRGALVRKHLLCETFGTPPANAGGVPQVDPNATTRERFEQHSKDPACASCHKYLDPVGFGFEQFDAIGRHRDTENGKPIDPSGDMNDVEGQGAGTSAPFTKLSEIGQTIANSRAAQQCFVKQSFRFSLGVTESSDELCVIEDLTNTWASKNHDVRELLVALVLHPTFQLRK